MRNIYKASCEGVHYVYVDTPNHNLNDAKGASHEEAIRTLHNFLDSRVSLIENLIDILSQGYEDFEGSCIEMLMAYEYLFDSTCNDSIIKCLKDLRVQLKAAARDIETGSVEYKEVEIEFE